MNTNFNLHDFTLFLLTTPSVLITMIFVIVAVTTISGIFKKTVIFATWNDLLLTTCSIIATAVILMLLLVVSEDILSVLITPALMLLTAMHLLIIMKAFKYSGIMAPFVLITKLFFGALFIISILDFLAPSGNSSSDRASTKRSGLLSLLFLTPIIIAIVFNKDNKPKILRGI